MSSNWQTKEKGKRTKRGRSPFLLQEKRDEEGGFSYPSPDTHHTQSERKKEREGDEATSVSAADRRGPHAHLALWLTFTATERGQKRERGIEWEWDGKEDWGCAQALVATRCFHLWARVQRPPKATWIKDSRIRVLNPQPTNIVTRTQFEIAQLVHELGPLTWIRCGFFSFS